MGWNLAEDLKYGKIRERLVVGYLNQDIFRDDKLNLYQNERKQVDFRNIQIIGELKSRKFNHDKHKETMFGYNKILYLEGLEGDSRDWYFYFFFYDGLYMWRYNEDEFEVRPYEHQERGWIDQVYVDIRHLICITKNIKNMSDTAKLMKTYKEYF